MQSKDMKRTDWGRVLRKDLSPGTSGETAIRDG